MAGVVLVPPKFQFLDAVGNPLANGKVDVYLAGTVTRTPTWQDQGQTTLNQNPILLDANGSCTMVVDDSLVYKLVVKNSANVEQTHAGGDNIVGGTTRLSQVSFTQGGAGAVARSGQDKMRETVSVKDFGAVGDGVTDDTAAIQAAINYAATFSEGKQPAIYIPSGEYVVSSTITLSSDNFYLYGDGATSRLRPTITDSTACLKIAAGTGSWFLDKIRIEATINETNYIAGTANAQACIGLDAYQTGSNFITRFHIGSVRIKNCAKGLRLGAFLGVVQDAIIQNCELGVEGTLLNGVRAVLRMENCRKDFSITDSNGLHLDSLMQEGFCASSVTSTIDNSRAVKITAPYWEWEATNARTQPFLTIGGTTQCQRVEIECAEISGSSGMATGVYPVALDRVDGVKVSAVAQDGAQGRAVSTSANTLNIERFDVFSLNSNWPQDASKQVGTAINYFPNRNFDLWFRGWAGFGATRCTMTKETSLVRRGANAVRLTGTAGQTTNYGQWTLTGAAVTALRGKTARIGIWAYIPDITAFDESNQTLFPGPKIQSHNGAVTVSSTTVNNRTSKGAWNFMYAEVAVQVDATEIWAFAFVNDSGTACDGTEYIVADNISICESSVPLSRQMAGELIDSPDIAAIGVGGRMITYASAAPSDPDQEYERGDQVWNTAAAAGGSPGWVCTTGGAGGVAAFKAMANVAP